MNWRAILTMAGFIVVAATVAVAVGGDEPAPTPTSLTCPAAAAVYEDAGLAAPQDFNRCPDPDALRRELEQATVSGEDAQAALALHEALEAGVISEGQDPATYPARLQRFVDG